jgi:acid phosphatase (class A)
MRLWLKASCLSALALGAGAVALGADRPSGYLAPGEFDVTHVIEPAPRKGDPRYETDRKIFKATRALVGTPRWQLATNDAEINARALLRDFSCSVGVALTPENAPQVANVIARATRDTGAQTSRAKEFYQRNRPYTIDKGRICQAPAELYDEKAHRVSYDYPSGHTTYGWTHALVLAALAPDRAQQILERGRAYGDSRFICGAHNESAVEGGMLSASATMALVATKTTYQADLSTARAELAALRANGPRPQGCEAEAALLAQHVMPRLGRGH